MGNISITPDGQVVKVITNIITQARLKKVTVVLAKARSRQSQSSRVLPAAGCLHGRSYQTSENP